MGRLDGTVAAITGWARRMGEAEACLFVAEGAKVRLGDVLDELGAAGVAPERLPGMPSRAEPLAELENVVAGQ